MMTRNSAAASEEITGYYELTFRRFGALILAHFPVPTGVPQRLLASAICACKSKQYKVLIQEYIFFWESFDVFRLV